MTPVVLSWSGGKDSLMALMAIEANPSLEIRALFTTVTDPQARISMHGIREALLDLQATALKLPLIKCRLPRAPDNSLYRERFAAAIAPLRDSGIAHVAFGDLFLEDVRAYREAQMRELEITPLFPIWGTPTTEVAERFIGEGHQAVLCSIDTKQLNPGLLGRGYDETLLAELPESVDPCGENGEFHTFVHAGPRFAQSVRFAPGRTHVSDGRFHFLDLT